MRAQDPRSAPAVRSSGDTRWITATVALFAICVFAASGAQILPEVLRSYSQSHSIRPHHVTTHRSRWKVDRWLQ